MPKLADALHIDAAELFTPDLPDGSAQRQAFTNVTSKLAALSDRDLDWLSGVIDAALKTRR